jgi:hypothetical protein
MHSRDEIARIRFCGKRLAVRIPAIGVSAENRCSEESQCLDFPFSLRKPLQLIFSAPSNTDKVTAGNRRIRVLHLMRNPLLR